VIFGHVCLGRFDRFRYPAVVGTPSALVTGATAGIGAAFTRRLSADGYAVTMVARDATRLAVLADELPGASALRADLSTLQGQDLVAARLIAEPVDLLINNAGIGLNRGFLHSSPEAETGLLALNVQAVMRLTLAALPAMVERGSGAVINVSSVAGFAAIQPGSTYPATKAWVTNFSESVDLSVRRRGVRVQALCPGFTRTEFHDRAGLTRDGIPRWMWLDADAVVDCSLRDLRRGRAVSVPDWRYRTATFALRHLPRGVLHRVAASNGGRRD
jgi:uncharacterized protein